MDKKKFRINFFDIIIAVVVIVVAGGVYFFTNKESVVETKKIVYTFELNSLPKGIADGIEIGDKLTDGVKNYNMGTVIGIEKTNYTILTTDYTTNTIKESVVPDKERAVVTVEANVTENGADYKVDGNFLVKTGLEVNVHGPGYAGSGYIISINR